MMSAFLLMMISIASCQKRNYKDLGDGLFADIQTNKGDMIVKLYFDQTPVTVANFVALAEGTHESVTDSLKGKPYYDGITFHRVIEDFMIQGGDPLGTGAGDPGYKFNDEFVDSLKLDRKGILAMANSGPNTNGSQFFITQKETPWLTGKHTVFGEVVKGLEVIDTIAKVKVNPRKKPIDPVIINHVEIIKNGKEARKFKAEKVFADYVADKEKREKEAAEKLAKAKAKVLDAATTQKEQAVTTDSGLQIYTIEEGTGEIPTQGDKVLVNYAGYLAADGSLFDSNIKEVAEDFGKYDHRREQMKGYEPIPMDYSNNASLIPGFKEALLSMKVGDKVRVFIPSFLGYGERGAGRGVIPPNADLIFDLEIEGIYTPEAAPTAPQK
ncbi:Peptidyl-prolyl cis-trans isomerase (rotamase)-cyclophilin family [Pustulibacterium marinum]|uniref:peptidylprolyl isomerase n=2 Tax=Pustulibacterium marinum TaxID=1224947 RepID=A0A1I7G542_9FLAO|nr:Peptidyl-prolyl cis-trans isomerase (rotamase)-cyclophilin family [Pustulibacterium marinum]